MTTTQITEQTFTAHHPTGRLTRRTVAVNLGNADVMKMIVAGTELTFELDGDAPISCPTCANGCDCESGTPGCDHFGCWGTATTTDCPDAPAARARMRVSLHNGNIERRNR
jgi:hypothetical protein